jgi:hypothetical protein
MCDAKMLNLIEHIALEALALQVKVELYRKFYIRSQPRRMQRDYVAIANDCKRMARITGILTRFAKRVSTEKTASG